MRTVLFTTDKSVFDLSPPGDVYLVVVPNNRYGTSKVNDLIQIVEKKGIEIIIQPSRKYWRTRDVLDIALKKISPHLGISWLYSQIIPQKVLDQFYGIMNYHGDNGFPLHAPYYERTLRASVERNDRVLRVMWQKAICEVDAGEILIESKIKIDNWKNSRKKLIDKGIKLFRSLNVNNSSLVYLKML